MKLSALLQIKSFPTLLGRRADIVLSRSCSPPLSPDSKWMKNVKRPTKPNFRRSKLHYELAVVEDSERLTEVMLPIRRGESILYELYSHIMQKYIKKETSLLGFYHDRLVAAAVTKIHQVRVKTDKLTLETELEQDKFTHYINNGIYNFRRTLMNSALSGFDGKRVMEIQLSWTKKEMDIRGVPELLSNIFAFARRLKCDYVVGLAGMPYREFNLPNSERDDRLFVIEEKIWPADWINSATRPYQKVVEYRIVKLMAYKV
ncbi:unnamed protein product [Bursaphelenchus okinawaensis]|uniref:Uncharacterized protein n=1 Tax=Bursaphelenchus okinawaensis TaxID=465554 RepID=A0A811L9X2_9BILA|nr:unnamed protein product [Bursaphelenchus okinawaensis]CAG9120475.1 unnamed protein product [Bursaphelenchus okinawaensis]